MAKHVYLIGTFDAFDPAGGRVVVRHFGTIVVGPRAPDGRGSAMQGPPFFEAEDGRPVKFRARGEYESHVGRRPATDEPFAP